MTVLSSFSYQQLTAACQAGGASTLSVATELAPAGGPHAAIAPAHRPGRGPSAIAHEIRLIDGNPTPTVVVDDNQSQIQRVEAAILQAIRDQHPLLSRVPHLQVSYEGGRSVYTDLELPQRIFDGHFLTGSIDALPAIAHPVYRAARESNPENARPVLELSPGSLVFGAIDAARGTGQSRFRGVLSGEIIGVLVEGAPTDSRAGADSVCCSRIIRTQVLSFAALRQLRFDCGPAGDEACRALLGAYALAGLARSNAELSIRANCDLVETGPTTLKLDARDGEFIELAALSIEQADELLERALIEAYREADITWRGQVLHVTGNAGAYAAAQNGGVEQAPVAYEPRRFRLPHFIEARRTTAH
ncbi:type I-U CRISPR-associated protein Cas7 [Mycolicibacter terrae]|uniref:type I-U CRISPR-associated protein Cas7 n=1 Tax=Mycolicibacter terrae TaxID=1788 RepID=UPI000B946F47|nr:type I-U CRISPR-associated protein Cas7 [Mycolicibacter terrae]SNV86947.1 CRISPR-associated protein GSU0053 (Cas_GSU0053) [Mycolicibacter terrae]